MSDVDDYIYRYYMQGPLSYLDVDPDLCTNPYPITNDCNKIFLIPWEGKSPQSDCICRAKPKNRIFTNGQFSGHLIFTKTIFSRRKKFVYPYKRELYFFEKKYFSFFFEKKCFF